MADYVFAVLVKVGIGQSSEIFRIFSPLFSDSAALAFGEAELGCC